MSSNPKISIITPSLNTGRYLEETIESIRRQTCNDYEHIVVDGGSTDNTLEILRKYPHIRWVSEREGPGSKIVSAFRRAFEMSRGKYIIQCCISDGFLDRDWFKRCLDAMEGDSEVSLVWGLPQYLKETGGLGRISYEHFLDDPPPQKSQFLPFWLATGFFYPEGNYCVRRAVFDRCFPTTASDYDCQEHPALWFVYRFNVDGFLPYFIPTIANFGRLHQASRQIVREGIDKKIENKYYRYVKNLRGTFLSGSVQHVFRMGNAEILQTVDRSELARYRSEIWKYRVMMSPFLRTDVYTAFQKLRSDGARRFIQRIYEKLIRT